MFLERRNKDDNFYQLLQNQKLDMLQQLSGNIWTDFNVHDPGVTIADIVNYALYELHYIFQLPLESFLSLEKETDFQEKGLFSTDYIFNDSIVTVNDYERLFRLLKTKYKMMEQASIRESDYRNATWLIIYAYLLTNRSSYFNKKSFIATTIKQLALRFNHSYDYLLSAVTSELDTWTIRQSMPSELFLILEQLRKELSDKTLNESAIDVKKLYQLVSEELNNKSPQDIHKKILEHLSIILSNPDTCRRFLYLMTEPQIYKLVEKITPDNSIFVIEYAQALDHQHEHGALEGKAGNEFRLLKWQIIFPVLLENSGLSFNRKYFVENVLIRVAAHYNLELLEILRYVCSYFDKLETESELTVIFKNLLNKYTNERRNKLIWSEKFTIRLITDIIKQKKAISVEEVQTLINRLSDYHLRYKIINTFTEKDHHKLISLIIPHESHFIIPYSIVLDKQKNNNILEGKAGSNFSRIKWEFIYAVLIDSQKQVFNKNYFVEKTLTRIAAHYNITVQDLLNYFYQEKIWEDISVPFDLVKAFKGLCISCKLGVTKENTTKNKIQKSKDILEKYFGTESSFRGSIITLSKQYEFVLFIKRVLQTIHLLEHYLWTELQVKTDKKQILELLLTLSKEKQHHNLNDILLYIIQLFMKPLYAEQQTQFIIKIKELSNSDNLLKNISDFINYKNSIMEKYESSETGTNTPSYVNNAGIVLIAPYLPRLFTILNITENQQFKTDNDRFKAIAVLQYIVFKQEKYPEHELFLNKLLTGTKNTVPLPQNIELTDNEKDTVESMLKGILQNWAKLKNTSITALREAFLQREGKIEEKDDFTQLIVEEKAYDMLLDSVPWNFRTIKFPWMEKTLAVKWR